MIDSVEVEAAAGYQAVEFLDIPAMHPEPAPVRRAEPDGVAADAADPVNWGPLWPLAGEWEGDHGVDLAFSHTHGEVMQTPYRERATFVPFGPVINGRQRLFGLDYSSAMWRGDETEPFHRSVGYWLWDGDVGELLHGFVVPRGVTVLAGGIALADALEFSVSAEGGGNSIVESPYLAKHASTLGYRATIAIHPDGSWSYEHVTRLAIREVPLPFAHADSNTLRRVG